MTCRRIPEATTGKDAGSALVESEFVAVVWLDDDDEAVLAILSKDVQN